MRLVLLLPIVPWLLGRHWLHLSVAVRVMALPVARYRLPEHTTGSYLGTNICQKFPIKLGVLSLVMRVQEVMSSRSVDYFFIHLFVENIGFGDLQCATSTFLMYLGCSSRRFNSRFKRPITASRGCNVCPLKSQAPTRCEFLSIYLSWFSS